MKVASTILATAALFALCGCNQSNPGGPGTALPESEKPMIGKPDNTFTLTAPMLATKVEQGGFEKFSIGIDREDGFTQDVTVSFSPLPVGVTIEPKSAVLNNTVDELEFTVRADLTATEAESTVGVNGHPPTGPDANAEMEISVTKADGA